MFKTIEEKEVHEEAAKTKTEGGWWEGQHLRAGKWS